MLMQGLTVFFAVLVTCHGKDIVWNIEVVTVDDNDAGTHARVSIKISGSDGKSTTISLPNSRDGLERGRTETFELTAPDVGKPTKIRVWHDKTGDSPDWHLDRIQMVAVNGEYSDTFNFPCQCWFGEKFGTERNILPASMKWKLQVWTTNMAGSAYYNKVEITINGNEGSTRKIELGRRQFTLGQLATFTIETKKIGTPKTLTVHTVHNDDWHLKKIVLKNFDGAATYTFDCNCWLGRLGMTTKELEPKKASPTTMKWSARVMTSKTDGNHYHSDVTIIISGTKGSTRPIPLDNNNQHGFDTGQTATFALTTVYIGSPTKITINTVHNDPWHVDKIVLEHLDDKKTYTFDCNCWLGKPGFTTYVMKLVT